VSFTVIKCYIIGLGVRGGKQGHPHYQLRWEADPEPLGAHRGGLSYILLARLGQSGKLSDLSDDDVHDRLSLMAKMRQQMQSMNLLRRRIRLPRVSSCIQ
jgi:hypothetical protein